jgi:hypothetical protein
MRERTKWFQELIVTFSKWESPLVVPLSLHAYICNKRFALHTAKTPAVIYPLQKVLSNICCQDFWQDVCEFLLWQPCHWIGPKYVCTTM